MEKTEWFEKAGRSILDTDGEAARQIAQKALEDGMDPLDMINEGFTELTGYTRQDVIGISSKDIEIWDNPEDRKVLVEGLQKNGATSLISSHALSEVEARANRFVIMKSGRLEACGTLDELYQQAALPLRLQLVVAPGLAARVAERLGSSAPISEVSETSLSLDCYNGDKMAMIRRISDLGDLVQDLQIKPPRLDEVYNHYMNRESA